MKFFPAILFLFGITSGLAQDKPQIVTVAINDSVQIKFVCIPAGSYIMGSPQSESDRDGDEAPQQEVNIKQFFFGAHEITQRQWQAVMGENPSIFRDYPDNPVEMVTWNDCQEFIKKLNRLGIGSFRLPSEAEWEYACRAGTSTRFYWGDDPQLKQIYDYAVFNPISNAHTSPVGQRKPNPWGLYDISGNVWEWCSDWRLPYDTELAQKKQPTEKIFRGGSWFDLPKSLRSANRHGHKPDEAYATIGLRLVFEP